MPPASLPTFPLLFIHHSTLDLEIKNLPPETLNIIIIIIIIGKNNWMYSIFILKGFKPMRTKIVALSFNAFNTFNTSPLPNKNKSQFSLIFYFVVAHHNLQLLKTTCMHNTSCKIIASTLYLFYKVLSNEEKRVAFE